MRLVSKIEKIYIECESSFKNTSTWTFVDHICTKFSKVTLESEFEYIHMLFIDISCQALLPEIVCHKILWWTYVYLVFKIINYESSVKKRKDIHRMRIKFQKHFYMNLCWSHLYKMLKGYAWKRIRVYLYAIYRFQLSSVTSRHSLS